MTIIDSLKYCQMQKGLEIYAYVLMPSHLHMLCRAKEGFVLADIMRDFKKSSSAGFLILWQIFAFVIRNPTIPLLIFEVYIQLLKYHLSHSNFLLKNKANPAALLRIQIQQGYYECS